MAEAHSAVAFSFAVTHEGFDVNVDYEALYQVWKSGWRSWKKRVARFKNSLRNGIYPAKPGSLIVIFALVLGFSIANRDITFGGLGRMQSFCGRIVRAPHDAYAGCALFSFVVWIFLILFWKYALLLLLSYTNWMYAPRGKMSLKNRLWMLAVKLLSGRKPGLYSFQGSLPRLPVPAVADTMKRYLRSVRAFMDDEQYDRMTALAADFQATMANRLQRYLVAKSWWSSNYVSDWWEEYVYLSGRSPIMVNSNFYGIDAIFVQPTSVQSARAGNVVWSMINFMRQVDREDVEPIFVSKTVPLCSWQYERQFNTCRIPGVEKDRLQHVRDSVHIAVLHRGAWFKLYFYFQGMWLEPCELQQQFQQILDSESEPALGEEQLPAMTAGDRTRWAEARRRYFRRGVNKTSLDTIEKAAFVVVLESEEHDYDEKDPSKLDAFARCMLHGKGNDRWFDKNFNFVVCKNGRVGFNAEHSWADAPVMSQLWEHSIFLYDLATAYDPKGNCMGTPRDGVPNPIRLQWDFNQECIAIMEQQLEQAKGILEDVDLHLVVHKAYGKGFIKTCRMSPDAYLQLALQLTYFRNAGKFCLTYEASMTRLFREGRTETVRSCTNEAVDFCRKMQDPSSTREDKLAAFRKAADYHQQMYRDAMTGKGIDRHLFCLYVVSKYLGLESPFLKEVLSEPWRLSTSQTPHGQTEKLDLGKNPTFISAGGGFGPVADDGYGVSYIIAGEDIIFFHISSKISCPTTSCQKFADELCRTLQDLRELNTAA